MKKNILISAFAVILLCLTQILSAVPAKPGKITITQPDGSTITIIVHGDEWFHYVTDEQGVVLEETESGKLVRSTITLNELSFRMAQAQQAKRLAIQQRNEAILKAQVSGAPKIPVILVQFSDKSFSISNPKTAFSNLLNQSGYSANGGTGSVLDYYTAQSRGAYTPQFVVMDVVTLSNRMSTYGSTDENAAKALYEACQKLNASVDFSQFDNDRDGKIDMALMYYAGYNEAEGGPSSTIWPHQFYVPYVVTNAQAFDGVTLNRYFCTSELKGASGTNMCGIGTTCHEFAHSLGLPDFYDTNYNEYGDGENGGTYTYDLMCSGSYNNNGCTPPWMGAEELCLLGWMDGITELTSRGSVTIPSIGASNPVAYKIPTSVSGEYFLLESRPGTDWDAPLTSGLLVYHVDKSTAHSITWKTSATASSTKTAYQLWANWETYNAINCLGSHPCYYIVPAGNQTSLNYSGSNFTFPGSSRITTYTPKEWSGSETGFTASQIAFNSSTKEVTFNLANSNECSVSGAVLDSDGNPIQGATVSLSTVSASNAPADKGPSVISRKPAILRAGGTVLQTVTTNASGEYSILLDNSGTFTLQASKAGYVSKSVTLDISRPVTQNFTLLREGETLPSEIITYPTDQEWYGYGWGEPYELMCANIFPASLLSPYEGKQIKTLSFVITIDDGENVNGSQVHALLDFGTERKVCLKVDNPKADEWTTVDLSGEGLVIPAGTDIFAGCALKDWPGSYPFICTACTDPSLRGYDADYDLNSTDWVSIGDYVFMIKLTVGDYVAPETGYNFIDNPGNGVYRVGTDFDLNLIETSSDRRPDNSGISWFFDDEPVSGTSVRLNSTGLHTVTARFTTESGNRKVVELEINVGN